MTDYAARVREGATLLDEMVPDWFRRIDTDTLNLNDGFMCVLGQVGGDWIQGLGMVGVRMADAFVYGFHVRHIDHGTVTEAERMFDLLRDYWYDEIEKRLSASLAG